MVFTKYSFPNPNNGDKYDLSQEWKAVWIK